MLKIILQTLQLFIKINKTESIFKSCLKMLSQKAWIERPSGLIKIRDEARALFAEMK